MLIQIQELVQLGRGRFTVGIGFEGAERFEVKFQNPHTPNVERDLEWYFEEYIQEPYMVESRVARAKQHLVEYGVNLFTQLFGPPEIYAAYKRGLDADGFDNIEIEVLGGQGSLEFHAILWETLRDPKFSGALATKGVSFRRKSLLAPPLIAKVNEHYSVNLLIVCSRPSGEHDVNYRTIQRPLIDQIQKTPRLRVKATVLRPGTFMALKEELQDKGGGYYHIIHFDMHGAVLDYDELARGKKGGVFHFSPSTLGRPRHFQMRGGRDDLKPFESKRAFLFFETEEGGQAEPTSAEEVGDLIQQFRIPVCVLNACQSAKQEGESSETNLAKFLHEQAGNLVLAMRYSVSVTGATKLMARFYEELLSEHSIEKSISIARQTLANEKNREASLGYQIELEDWALPTTYKYQDVDISLRAMTKDEELKHYAMLERQYRAPVLEFGFHGRDLDIMKIERLLLKQNHLLLRGMVGVGKTALLQHLAEWWSLTAFRGASQAVYFDCSSGTPGLSEVVNKIGSTIFTQEVWCERKRDALVGRKWAVLKELNAFPAVLVFDGINGQMANGIIQFLSEIRGQSFVIYGSVSDEQHLRSCISAAVYWLDGLDRDGTYKLAGEILRKKAGKNIRNLVKHSKFELDRLLEALAGNPAAMEAILPSISSMSVKDALDSFLGARFQIKRSEPFTGNQDKQNGPNIQIQPMPKSAA